MSSNVIFFAWNRSVPGRERLSAEHFGEFVQYLGGLHQAGAIQSFEVVFLDIHGGDLNGFFLVRGANTQLNELVDSEAWVMHMVRARLHMEGAGVVRGATGDLEAVMHFAALSMISSGHGTKSLSERRK